MYPLQCGTARKGKRPDFRNRIRQENPSQCLPLRGFGRWLRHKGKARLLLLADFRMGCLLFCRKCPFGNRNDGQSVNLGRNMQLRTATMQLFQHHAALFFFVFYLYGQILFCHWNFPFFRPPFACPLSQFFRVFYLSTLSTLSILCPPFFILYPLYSP